MYEMLRIIIEILAVTDIVSEINKKYVECIPDLVTTNKLIHTIRSTCSIVNHSVDSTANNRIESLICQLWHSSNEENSLANAALLVELERKSKDILQKLSAMDILDLIDAKKTVICSDTSFL
uniref:Uncharacterized protein n=1 Tax=Wuchereria bancrofti TaxID=6293 RepID=A0A1I8EX12_WUCBA